MKSPAAEMVVRLRRRAIDAMDRMTGAMGKEAAEIREMGDRNKGRENHRARQTVGRRLGVPRACDARGCGQYPRSTSGAMKSLFQT